MADGLDVVAVGVEHEGGVVIGMVMRAQARRAVVPRAGGDRRCVEGIDLGAVARGEGDMDAPLACGAEAFADPEERLALSPEADRRAASGLLVGDSHDDADAERGERLQIELGRPGQMADRDADMVDHGRPLPLLYALDQLALEGGDRGRRVQTLGAGLGAVHDGVSSIEPEAILELVEPLAGALVAAVLDPAVGLEQDGGAEIAVAVPPIGGAGGRTAGAQDALVEPVELVAIL